MDEWTNGRVDQQTIFRINHAEQSVSALFLSRSLVFGITNAMRCPRSTTHRRANEFEHKYVGHVK